MDSKAQDNNISKEKEKFVEKDIIGVLFVEKGSDKAPKLLKYYPNSAESKIHVKLSPNVLKDLVDKKGQVVITSLSIKEKQKQDLKTDSKK